MEELAKKLMARTWELPLGESTFVRRGDGERKEYKGPALLVQSADGCFELKMFALGTDPLDEFNDDEGWDCVPGEMTPESNYYDWSAMDLAGKTWEACRVSLTKDIGAGAYLRSTPGSVTCVEKLHRATKQAHILALLDGDLELPWHEYSRDDQRGGAYDLFAASTSSFVWNVTRKESGVWLKFEAHEHSLEVMFENFLRALSMLVGMRVTAVVCRVIEGSTSRTIVRNVLHYPTPEAVICPFKLERPDFEDANRFIGLFMHKALAEGDQGINGGCRSAFRYWLRILGARATDMETEALVLSVAIEGFLKKAILPLCRPDPDFSLQVSIAKGSLKSLRRFRFADDHPATLVLKELGIGPFGERAFNCVGSSLSNALRPRVQDGLMLLLDHGALTSVHLESWKALRHTAAHGDMLQDELPVKKLHIRQIYACLDLFYRLVFLWIGYRGSHRDLSSLGLPNVPFDGSLDALRAIEV